MNEKPHVHEFNLTRCWPSINQGHYVLEYGDQECSVGWWARPPSKRQLERAKRRVVKKHDRASQRAGRAPKLGRIAGPAFDGEHWPSERSA